MKIREYNSLTFNIKNFKTNHYCLKEIIAKHCIHISFITEHWLNEGEIDIVKNQFRDKKIFFYSDMMLECNNRAGRPYGGKMWIIDDLINIVKYEFINSNISYLIIEDQNNRMQVYIGVYIDFDNKQYERYAQYISNLQIIESLIEQYSNLPIFIMGTSTLIWNATIDSINYCPSIY